MFSPKFGPSCLRTRGIGREGSFMVSDASTAVRVFSRPLVVIAVAAVALTSGSQAGAARTPTVGEKTAIVLAAKSSLVALASKPGSAIRHGTKVVLTPICLSTFDPRFAVAVASPVNSGVVGQSGLLFFKRNGKRFDAVGGLRTGDQYYRRPVEITATTYRDLRRAQCTVPPSGKTVLRLAAEGRAPAFEV